MIVAHGTHDIKSVTHKLHKNCIKWPWHFHCLIGRTMPNWHILIPGCDVGIFTISRPQRVGLWSRSCLELAVGDFRLQPRAMGDAGGFSMQYIISILHIVTNYFIHFYTWLPLPIARSKGLVWRSFSSVSLCSHDSHVCGIDRQNKKLSIAVLSEWQPSHLRLILVLPWFWSSSSLSPSESPQRQHHHHPQNTAIKPHVWSLWRFQYTPAPSSSNVLLT